MMASKGADWPRGTKSTFCTRNSAYGICGVLEDETKRVSAGFRRSQCQSRTFLRFSSIEVMYNNLPSIPKR